VVESYRFDPWGRVLGAYDGAGELLTSDLGSLTSAVGNRYLFQGREHSWATGLYYFRARWYDPVTGRWLSHDPIGVSGGLNQCSFCSAQPVSLLDPYGCRARVLLDGKTRNVDTFRDLKFAVWLASEYGTKPIQSFEYRDHGEPERGDLFFGGDTAEALVSGTEVAGWLRGEGCGQISPTARILLKSCGSANPLAPYPVAKAFKECLPGATVYGYTGMCIVIGSVSWPFENTRTWRKRGTDWPVAGVPRYSAWVELQ
jgi:RHS repeat-associated protein